MIRFPPLTLVTNSLRGIPIKTIQNRIEKLKARTLGRDSAAAALILLALFPARGLVAGSWHCIPGFMVAGGGDSGGGMFLILLMLKRERMPAAGRNTL